MMANPESLCNPIKEEEEKKPRCAPPCYYSFSDATVKTNGPIESFTKTAIIISMMAWKCVESYLDVVSIVGLGLGTNARRRDHLIRHQCHAASDWISYSCGASWFHSFDWIHLVFWSRFLFRTVIGKRFHFLPTTFLPIPCYWCGLLMKANKLKGERLLSSGIVGVFRVDFRKRYEKKISAALYRSATFKLKRLDFPQHQRCAHSFIFIFFPSERRGSRINIWLRVDFVYCWL